MMIKIRRYAWRGWGVKYILIRADVVNKNGGCCAEKKEM